MQAKEGNTKLIKYAPPASARKSLGADAPRLGRKKILPLSERKLTWRAHKYRGDIPAEAGRNLGAGAPRLGTRKRTLPL